MKNGKANTERAEGFVMLPRSAIDRMAAAQLSAAAWRVLVFLMRELLRHGGRDNGQLKAPHRQLVSFGVSASLVSSAIKELEAAGLVRCHRKGQRAANLFELPWVRRAQGGIERRSSATINGGRYAM
jgi:hypothetical protein